MDAKLKEKIEKCTTEKQVRRVLAENKIRIVRDNTWEQESIIRTEEQESGKFTW